VGAHTARNLKEGGADARVGVNPYIVERTEAIRADGVIVTPDCDTRKKSWRHHGRRRVTEVCLATERVGSTFVVQRLHRLIDIGLSNGLILEVGVP